MKEKSKTLYDPPKLEIMNVVTEEFMAQSLQNPIDLDMNSYQKYNWDEQSDITSSDIYTINI